MEIHAMKLPLYGFYADVNVRKSMATYSWPLENIEGKKFHKLTWCNISILMGRWSVNQTSKLVQR